MMQDAYSPYERAIECYGGSPELFRDCEAYPSFDLLQELVSIAAARGKTARSGDVARALDMWVAAEFRRAGFPADAIWPRLVMPRALDASVLSFIKKMNPALVEQCCDELTLRYKSATASVMGAAYAKQVDVGMSSWPSGPELLVSTKTMSSSFGKNMANRFEEAYGDAKNLKSRHPFAAVGFVFLVHADILSEPAVFSKAISMLEKLQAEPDVYDAVGLLVADWSPAGAELTVGSEFIPGSLSMSRFFEMLVKLVLSHASPDSYSNARSQFGKAV